MISQSRRKFLKNGIGGGAVVLGATALGSLLLRKYLPSRYAKGQLGCFSTVYVSESRGFIPSFSLTALAGTTSPRHVTESIDNYFSIFFFTLSGDLEFHQEFKLDTLSEKIVELKGELGWGSVVIASALDTDSNPNGQMDALSSIRQRTPFGEDGHHSQILYRDPSLRSSIAVSVPDQMENRIVSLFNSDPNQSVSAVDIFDQDGKLVVSKDLVWRPFETKYFRMGDPASADPPAADVLSLDETVKHLLFNVRGRNQENITLSTMHSRIQDKPFFNLAHGANYRLRKPEYETPDEMKLLTAFQQATHLKDVGEYKGVYPGDLVCLNGNPFNGEKWKSSLIVPNPNENENEINFGFLISDKEGNVVVNSFQERGFIKVPTSGVKHIDFTQEFRIPEQCQYGVISVYLGQVTIPYSLVKILTSDHLGRKSVQHLRPQQNVVQNKMFPAYMKSTNQWMTDYWLGNNEFSPHQDTFVLIRNIGNSEETEAFFQYIGEEGIISETKLAPISLKGFQVIPLPRPPDLLSFGMRLVAPRNELSFTLCKFNPSGHMTIRHASAKFNRFPFLFDIDKLKTSQS